MNTLKGKFENKTKTRINIIGSENAEKNYLKKLLVKQDLFNKIDLKNDYGFYRFPTELLCSSCKNDLVNVYLDFKEEEEIIKEVRDNILKSIYEAAVKEEWLEKENKESLVENFTQNYIYALGSFYESALNNFFEKNNIKDLFETVNFQGLFYELKRIDYIKEQEILDCEDDLIWERYFEEFQINMKEQYEKWKKRILEYYDDQIEGYEFINEYTGEESKYSNEDFNKLCEILYGSNSSCALMIKRAYIEVPSSNEKYSGKVFIYLPNANKYESVTQKIEKRIGEDYKELFIVVGKSYKDFEHSYNFKEKINDITLSKRIFYLLSKFSTYENQLLIEEIKRKSANMEDDFLEIFKSNISKKLGISAEKITVTEDFKDFDEISLKPLNTNDNFLNLLARIKKESEEIQSTIKIKSSSKEKVINISLNQERMSVQALVGMLYERYNSYLVDLWNKIIEGEKLDKDNNKYDYSEIRSIILNRKDDYKEYKHISCENINRKQENIIDFSLKSGDYNDSKKILKMLVNYGYNTVGFNSNESKIIVSVEGEISKEDKEKLIKSIKGRLEESAVNYFENAFLVHVSEKKFNKNNLYKALEAEKNITINDFYFAFKEVFRRISENILRYEVLLQ
ncbi:hypothetical protein [Clostridium sp. C2-6-12]|uniref:hypothetical protein n=1 Tax=Clostridium sp. C2-6-12 TaxID=2698832 RepID=UPI0013681232|nr:hypothetical protein [Clostridium sp. C2-6-12]